LTACLRMNLQQFQLYMIDHHIHQDSRPVLPVLEQNYLIGMPARSYACNPHRDIQCSPMWVAVSGRPSEAYGNPTSRASGVRLPWQGTATAASDCSPAVSVSAECSQGGQGWQLLQLAAMDQLKCLQRSQGGQGRQKLPTCTLHAKCLQRSQCDQGWQLP
jgi:hypothetical protein